MIAVAADTLLEEAYLENAKPAAIPAPRATQTIVTYMGTSTLSQRVMEITKNTKAEIIAAESAEELLQDLSTIRIDLIFIDAQLPDENSLDVCRTIRQKSSVPIIMLTDNPSAEERLQGYQIEIDEYIDNSVTNEEIKARIDTLFNRLNFVDRTSEPIRIGGLYINLARREVMLNNQPLELTRIEYDLLRILAINSNQVLEHEQLLTKVWGPEYRNDKHYLWVNISRLRKKIEPDEHSHRYIHNRPGIGYMLRKP